MRLCKCFPHASKIPRLTDNLVSSDVYTGIKGYDHGASPTFVAPLVLEDIGAPEKNTYLPLICHIHVVSSTLTMSCSELTKLMAIGTDCRASRKSN
jgi:hypothetical protein